MPAASHATLPLPGLSPVAGKPIIARFDGGSLSSDGGLLALREIEERLGVARRLAGCIDDPRAPERIQHSLAEMLRFRLLMIAAGCEDGNDADSLRHDPLFKLANGRLPDATALCSQPTLSRLENMPGPRALIGMARAMVALYCASFRQGSGHCPEPAHHAGHRPGVPTNSVRGVGRHLRCRPWRPAVTAVQRLLRRIRLPADCRVRRRRPPCCRHAAPGQASHRRRGAQSPAPPGARDPQPLAARRDPDPRRQPRGAPEVLDFCRAARIDFLLGVAATTTLRRHVATLEASTASRQEAAPGDDKLRRYKEFRDGAASWSRVERIIARVEASAQGTDTRFVVTNLAAGSARTIHGDLYCRRGQAENHIKAWKRHLAADRTSCCRAAANQFRLMLHTGAYWLLWSLRSLMPKRSTWRVAQFDTRRLRLVKLATRVVAPKTRVMLHLPSACPDKAILRLALERLPRLAC